MPHSSGGGSHGGGSHSSHHSSHHSSSHRSGSSYSSAPRTSHAYFPGAIRYAYYRKGKIEYYYRSSEYNETEKKQNNVFFIVWYAVMIPLYVLLIAGLLANIYIVPQKLAMDYPDQDILISDDLGILSESDIQGIKRSLQTFQDETGISPALMLIKNSEWQPHYSRLEKYAYEEYVERWDDEKHWLIIFSSDSGDEWQDWYWEGMQGDDTDSILTEQKTDAFTTAFHRALLKDDEHFAKAFTETFDSFNTTVMDMTIDPEAPFVLIFIFLHGFIMLGIPLIILISRKKAYDKVIHSVKLQEGVQYREDNCLYCGGLFIHGLHLSCPHCGATLPAAEGPVNVDPKIMK